jgi:hypothetical protein
MVVVVVVVVVMAARLLIPTAQDGAVLLSLSEGPEASTQLRDIDQ